MNLSRVVKIGVLLLLGVGTAIAALVVPREIEQPGTQPGEIGNLEGANKCDNCHGGYNAAVEPAHNWRGSMMANAGRDPIFWATLAIAEQDFDGSGDLCLRCHSTKGWLGGRSTPTDGSGLAAHDADGVSCDYCHKLTNPDNSEHPGVMNAPYVANDGDDPPIGYYGSGMSSVWGGGEKLGPYQDADANHKMMASTFHRSRDFCGTCHDVSNPAVGDLAHNNGAQVPLEPGTFSGTLGGDVTAKAAFNNLPYQYGVVERTFSEHKSSLLSQTLVSEYASLPDDLKAGAIKAAYEGAVVAGTGGNYQDGSPRFFSCQTCHMRPVTGKGCNKRPPERPDLPLHDMTGGNYWMPDVILYLDAQNKLRLGGGLTDVQTAALADGKLRAIQQLNQAISMSVEGNVLKIVNLTGHKVISGYPEGRRMWLNIKWYDDAGNDPIREDGGYGTVAVTLDAQVLQVETILDLDAAHTKIYEAHYAMTKEWAQQLINLGYSVDMPLTYDRVSGAVTRTLGQLAAQQPGTCHETFHFVLNNYVAKDNRIPPYGMSYDAARARNALPVPADQYGDPGEGGLYNHWDEITLDPPPGATHATIDMLYQPTSWEYVQFLYLANNRSVAFLAQEGDYLLDAWLNTDMARPHVMASITWQRQLLRGDFNGDDVVDVVDVDLLLANLSSGNPAYDLTGDGVVDSADVDELITNILGTFYGDADLNGCVDDLDLTAVAVHWQQQVASWENGDFNGDGIVNDLDLTALAVNWQQGCGGGGSFADAWAARDNAPEPARR